MTNETKIKCVKLPRFRDILKHPTQPGTTFAKEISDRIRVIACLDNTPNMIHSDSVDETIGSTFWQKIKKTSHFQPVDGLVVVWGMM